jgi:hypothetical protein
MKNLILLITLLVSITCSSFAQHTVRMKGFVVFSDWVGVDGVIVDISENGEIVSINEVSDLTKINKVFIQLSEGSKKRNDELSIGNAIVKHKIFVQAVNDYSSLEVIKRSMRNQVIQVNSDKSSAGKRLKSASKSGMVGVVLPIVGATVGVLTGGTVPIIVGGVLGLAFQIDSWNQVGKAGTELEDTLRTLNKK